MYQVLARKYRPQKFKEVIGQDHITRALSQAVANKRYGHAYIFAGPRGVGKTTTARILTKAVNCEKPADGEPCNTCTSCQEITRGGALDVQEIDAASYTGVDSIRELRDGALLAPARDQHKVFILDEAHMLSKPAFNALLKILEEPPPHVIFILSTTESEAIIPTVSSRCQRFHFRRVGIKEIVSLLTKITKKEKIAIEEEATYLIARSVDGCVRDAESALDQIIALAADDAITADLVIESLGVVPQETTLALLDAIVKHDETLVLSLLDASNRDGYDPIRLAEALLGIVRTAFLIQLGNVSEEVLEVSEETAGRIRKTTGTVAADRLARMLDQLFQTIREMKLQEEYASLILEVGLLRSVREALLPTLPEILATVQQLRSTGGIVPAPVSPTAEAAPPVVPVAQHAPAAPVYWPAALEAINEDSKVLGALMKEAELVTCNASKVVLGIPSSHPYHLKKLKENEKKLTEIVGRVGGENIAVEICELKSDGSGGPGRRPDPGRSDDGPPLEAPPEEDVPSEEDILQSDPLIRQITSMFKGKLEKVHD